MTYYRITITFGRKRVPISEWIVSRSEAEEILATTHPALEPQIEETRV